MYQALYRKWRPRRFDDVCGQEHVTETLKRQVMSGKLSHAYLFTGTRGTGKTSCAKILAKVVNCENAIDGNPCNACFSCLGIDNGSIFDVTEMDAASNNGVDNVRALQDEAVYLPTSVKKRVYIVDEVHMMTSQAFNALLKILEEPPEHLMFILATTELHKVPATVLSRCQKFAFKRAVPADIVSRLEYIAGEEGFELTADASELLARLADGSFRDAISLLDQCSGSTYIDKPTVLRCIGLAENFEICDLLSDILLSDAAGVLQRLDRLYRDGKDVGSVLSQLSSLLRDILLLQLAPDGGTDLLSGSFGINDLRAFHSSAPMSFLLDALAAIQTVLVELDRSADRRIAAEICLLRLCDLPSGTGTVLPAEPKQDNPGAPFPTHVPEPDYAQKSGAGPEAEQPDPIIKTPDQAAPDTRRSWQQLLNILSKSMDSFQFGILEDANHSETVITGNTISIYAKSPFSMGQLDTNEIKEAIKSAAQNCWGGVFSVKVMAFSEDRSEKKSKLEQLSRFGNIKFE
ncbi:MAG: DNA polymerase III subunit gamma/tau [Clostridiales bacterium]|jgi:DNA polymerase-3 subunit gamma/tau|nr:DNA polymerase III subunit gamma/tau [Clostridiales bacterium]